MHGNTNFTVVNVYVENPCEIKYTWQSNGSQIRIDYFLISSSLREFVNECDIKFGYRSDHSAITIEINRSVPNRGPGFLKLNSSLLMNEKIKEEIKLSIVSFF